MKKTVSINLRVGLQSMERIIIVNIDLDIVYRVKDISLTSFQRCKSRDFRL